MKTLLVIPLALALSSCAGVTVGFSIGYQGISTSITVTKVPDPKPPVVTPPPAEPDGKAPVPVNPVDETQPQT